MPLNRRDGSYFGTLCALDTTPAALNKADVDILTLVASLIAYELEAQDEYCRRETELAAAQEEAVVRERLIGILGHDLRTPLTAVALGASDLLEHETLGDSAGRTVVGILASARRATRMIADLLDFTRARLGGGIPVQRVETDLLAVTRKVVSEIRAAHPGRTIEISATGSTHGRWDPDRAAQVVANLITNAINHGSAAAPVVISLHGEPETVTLVVRNSGARIPPHVLQELFSPFRRGQHGNASGLGLGLFIVQQIVDAHGGSVHATSDECETSFETVWPKK